MYKLIIACFLLFFSAESAVSQQNLNSAKNPDSAAEITLFINSPGNNQIVDTLLYVEITIQSTYEIQYVTASVSGRQTDLTYSPENGTMRGTISLNGLFRGLKTLNIRAVDIFNNEYTVGRNFIYDRKPVIEVINPVQNGIESLSLRIKADFFDDNISGGQINVLLDDANLFSKNASFDTTIDISQKQEGSHSLRLIAYDSLNQYMEVTRSFLQVKSPALVLSYLMPYPVWDMDSSRIFSGSGRNVRITDYKTGTNYDIVLPRDLIVIRARLTRDGFLCVLEPQSAYLNDSVYVYTNGLFYCLGAINSTTSLVVKNKWTLWNNNQVLRLRDNESGVITNIASNTINNGNDVAPDGTVAYGTIDYQIFSYKNGQTHQLTFNGSSIFPLTDGTSYLYRRYGNGILVLNDGVNETILAEDLDFWPPAMYNINNGWIAYCKMGTIGQTHVWMRNAAGQEKRITPFGTSSRIIGLNSDGQCIIKNLDDLYLADFSGILKRFTSLVNGTPVWVNNELYYICENAVFKVDTSLTAINDKPENEMNFTLYQNYPNPFNPVTSLSYRLDSRQFITLKVFDILGNEVITLVAGEEQEGTKTVVFDGRNLASGLYFARLTAENKNKTIKMMLLK